MRVLSHVPSARDWAVPSGESTVIRGASWRCELRGSGVSSALVKQQHILNQLSLFYLPFATVIIFYFLSGYWLWKLINIFYYCQFCHQNPCSSPCFLIICFSRTVLKKMEFWPLLNYFIFATAFIIKIEGLVRSAIKIFPLVRVFKKQIWVPTGPLRRSMCFSACLFQ